MGGSEWFRSSGQGVWGGGSVPTTTPAAGEHQTSLVPDTVPSVDMSVLKTTLNMYIGESELARAL